MAKQYRTAPELTIDESKTYKATLHTSAGDIEMDLAGHTCNAGSIPPPCQGCTRCRPPRRPPVPWRCCRHDHLGNRCDRIRALPTTAPHLAPEPAVLSGVEQSSREIPGDAEPYRSSESAQPTPPSVRQPFLRSPPDRSHRYPTSHSDRAVQSSRSAPGPSSKTLDTEQSQAS